MILNCKICDKQLNVFISVFDYCIYCYYCYIYKKVE